MRLDRFIGSRLACSARTAQHMIAAREVLLNGVPATDGSQAVSTFCRVEAAGRVLRAREPVYLMLHKPRGCVSATTDCRHPTVLDLIDLPGRDELHLAGRLDFNTTGLLLLSNDGSWTRRITLPERKIPKTYLVRTRDPITPEYAERFAAGIYLRYENLVTQPAQLVILSATRAELTIHEGRYHQVRRMFGFFRNEVVALHRLAVGGIVLDAALAPGGWRHLAPAEIAAADALDAPGVSDGRIRRESP